LFKHQLGGNYPILALLFLFHDGANINSQNVISCCGCEQYLSILINARNPWETTTQQDMWGDGVKNEVLHQ